MHVDFNREEWIWAGAIVGAAQLLLYLAYWRTGDAFYSFLAIFPGGYAWLLFPKDAPDYLRHMVGLVANFVLFTPIAIAFLRIARNRLRL